MRLSGRVQRRGNFRTHFTQGSSRHSGSTFGYQIATSAHEGFGFGRPNSFYFGVFASRKSRTVASSCSFVTSNTFSMYCFACDTELVDMET